MGPLAEPPSVTCPRCGRTSYDPKDVAEGYCFNCHDWTSRAAEAGAEVAGAAFATCEAIRAGTYDRYLTALGAAVRARKRRAGL